jgi:hypothetical protein
MDKQEEERWVDIAGYEGVYQVSTQGRVRSLDRTAKGRNGVIKGKIKHQGISNSGYCTTGLYLNGKLRTVLVHRLVANAFVKNPNNLPEVNHLNEDKTDNTYTNLEWSTRSGNALHSVRKFRGSNSGTSKLTEEQVVEIIDLLGVMPQTEIGKLYGVSNHTIHKIKSGGNWSWLTNLERR